MDDDMLTITGVCTYGGMGQRIAALTGSCELVSASHAFITAPRKRRRRDGQGDHQFDTWSSVVSLLVVIRAPRDVMVGHRLDLERRGMVIATHPVGQR